MTKEITKLSNQRLIGILVVAMITSICLAAIFKQGSFSDNLVEFGKLFVVVFMAIVDGKNGNIGGPASGG
jgi:hypothetical protein